MFFRQFYDPRLAQYSYMIGCQATGQALVVDPLRDIDQYIRAAEKERLRITHVTETHIHADFLSGARTLAHELGAELLLSDEGGEDWQYAFPHQGLREGDDFWVGNVRIEVLHTPGHTPEHISFVVTDTPSGDLPGMILTGDFVFVGDVGRPDLLDLVSDDPGISAHMARLMFASLHKFRALPDHLLVWPGHGAGSACGRSLGASPASTVGYEKLTNWALREQDEDDFVLRLLAAQPMPPRYFRNMKLWNRSGEKTGKDVIPMQRLPIQKLEDLRQQGVMLVDTRDKLAFAEGHIPGSVNIPAGDLFTTWAGWILEPEKPFVLIAPETIIADLFIALYRIGLDQVAGYFTDVHFWAQVGNELVQLTQMNASELAEAMAKKTAIAVDIRELYELNDGYIPGAISATAGNLILGAMRPDIDRTLVLYCGKGDRSAIVASYLIQQGLDNVMSLREGISDWVAAGFELETPETQADFERIGVLQANQRLATRAWTLIDIREADEFEKGHPVGALNYPLSTFFEDDRDDELRAKGPLLLICNTGNRSSMASEWLLEEGFTDIANVEGGVVAWQLHQLPWQK